MDGSDGGMMGVLSEKISVGQRTLSCLINSSKVYMAYTSLTYHSHIISKLPISKWNTLFATTSTQTSSSSV